MSAAKKLSDPVIATPGTLESAIQNALPFSDSKLAKQVYDHVRDFLAQRFSTAVMESYEAEADGPLLKLFDEIVERSK